MVAAATAIAAIRGSSVTSGTSTSSIHPGVRAESSTRTAPPAATTSAALSRCSPLPMGYHNVGGRIRQLHPIDIGSNDIGGSGSH